MAHLGEEVRSRFRSGFLENKPKCAYENYPAKREAPCRHLETIDVPRLLKSSLPFQCNQFLVKGLLDMHRHALCGMPIAGAMILCFSFSFLSSLRPPSCWKRETHFFWSTTKDMEETRCGCAQRFLFSWMLQKIQSIEWCRVVVGIS